MKFSAADPADGYTIQAYDKYVIVIGERRFTESLVLLPDHIIPRWSPRSVEDLRIGHFQEILELGPDLLLLGTGETQQFPGTDIYGVISAAHRGLEVMTTPAACRTYNILAAEGRRVAAALLIDPST